MITIAHRANLYGPSDEENTYSSIQKCLDQNLHVEVDVRLEGGDLWLGHDSAKELTHIHELMDSRIWCHAKTPRTFALLSKYSGIQTFYQESDAISLTSNGYLWCHSDNPLHTPKSILTILDTRDVKMPDVYGVCTDYPFGWHPISNRWIDIKWKPKLIILDVDGVMTPGYKEYGKDGLVVSKSYCDKDWTAIKRFKSAGVNVVFLSGDPINEAVANMRKIPFYCNNFGTQDKYEFIPTLIKNWQVDISDMVFVGDDYYDLMIMENLYHTYCPLDAISDVKNKVTKVLPAKGGRGVVAALYEELKDKIPFVFPYDSPEANGR